MNIISKNNFYYNDDITKLIYKQIQKKINSYCNQDNLKNLYDSQNFINFKNIIQRLLDCKLKCYYCKIEMLVLYDVVRETKQWTVDRINNNIGHNNDNFHIACLECNLKRKRINDEKFLFTKQLNIVRENYVL